MWHCAPLIAFDLETTGTAPAQDRIVTAAARHIHPAEGRVEHYEWLLNPGMAIPEPAAAVHGITSEYAATHGRAPAGALLEIAAHVGDAARTGTPLVAYNAPFDLTMLRAECARYDAITPAIGPVIDPLVLDRGIDKYRRGSRRLTATAAHYGVPLAEAEAHGAGADALAAARLAWKLAEQHPDLARASVDELHEQQARWHADWAEQFESWLARQPDREAMAIPRGWPTHENAPAGSRSSKVVMRGCW